MSDTSSSNIGVIVDADGKAGGVFPGGLEIVLDDGSPFTDRDRIRWVRLSDGALVAMVEAFTGAGSSTVAMSARQPGGTNFIALIAERLASGTERIRTENATGVQRLIIDSDARSSFLQLAGDAHLELALGIGSVTFTGSGPDESATAIVSHNLGRTPQFAAAVGALTGEPGTLFWHITPQGVVAWDSTNVTFAAQLNNDQSASGTWPFMWAAIG